MLPLLPAPAADAADAAVCASYADAAKRIAFGTDYSIMVRLSGKFITAADDGNVMQWEARSGDSQNWHIIDAGGGYVAFLAGADHTKAITVEGGDSTNGNNFSLSAYTGADSQMFRLNRTDDAYYITAKCSGNAAMDVYDISYDNGANIDQWDYWGGEGQKFYIRPAENKYRYLRCDLDFDGVLTAKDLTLQKRGLMQGFDDLMTSVAHCGDYTAAAVPAPDQVITRSPVAKADAEALSEYLTVQRDKFSLSEISEHKYYEGAPVAYLFAYFLGNAPEQERLSYAVFR